MGRKAVCMIGGTSQRLAYLSPAWLTTDKFTTRIICNHSFNMLFVFISVANVRQYFQFAKNLKGNSAFFFQIIIQIGGVDDNFAARLPESDVFIGQEK